MKRTAFDQFDDKRVAEGANDDRALMCSAHQCPNRWSVDNGSGRLCSAHAWSDRLEWPAITAQQHWQETERARKSTEPKPPAPKVDKAEVIRKLQAFAGGQTGKAWAYALRDREQAGELLPKAHRDMWRAALGGNRILGADDE
jgi:hypothetical protein